MSEHAEKMPRAANEADCCSPAQAGFGGTVSRNRLGTIAFAAIVIGGGLYLGWPWLGAIGAAPLLIAMAPCAIMCGLGLCVMKGGSRRPDSVAPSESGSKTGSER